jgi:hypothetical protein
MSIAFEPEEEPAAFTLRLRIPDGLTEAEILVNGQRMRHPAPEKGYVSLKRAFAAGDTVEIRGTLPLIRETIGSSVAFRRGPLVLARDEEKEPAFTIQAPVTKDKMVYRMLPPEKGEMIRILLEQQDGWPPVLLTDYASCGKRWDRRKNRVTVWMKKNGEPEKP